MGETALSFWMLRKNASTGTEAIRGNPDFGNVCCESTKHWKRTELCHLVITSSDEDGSTVIPSYRASYCCRFLAEWGTVR